MLQRQFSSCDIPVFQKNVLLQGESFVHATFFMKLAWFEFVRHEAATKCPQFPMSNRAHCSCALFQQHASYAVHGRGGLYPLHIPATCVATLKLSLNLFVLSFYSSLICHRALCNQQCCQFCGFLLFRRVKDANNKPEIE